MPDAADDTGRRLIDAARAAVDVRGAPGALPGPLAAETLLISCAGAALAAAAGFEEVRTGRRPSVALERDRLAVAAASERHVRLDGRVPGITFHPLSAFFAGADGWIRTHANYPWHHDALLRAVGVADGGSVAAAIAERPVLEVEEAVVAAGGCAAAARTAAPWEPLPLVARRPGPVTSPRPADPPRVIDLTRVIAGPVGTRYLAALGADVVRIDDPARPELPISALDGGLGKRTLAVDLRTDDLDALLAAADVIVDGHRPGALDRFGLGPDALAERHPQLVHVSLSAWGERGPWGTRRGFDSLVQAASGIAEAITPSTPDRPPGALPVQALDHATGYLIAAAALDGLTERARTGEAPRFELALAATADALLALPRTDAPGRPVDPAPHLVDLGRLRVALPPGEIDGVPLAWPQVR